MKDVATLLPLVVGPYDRHCAGAGIGPGTAYVTTPVIGTGTAPLSCGHAGSHLLDQIIAFDRAEGENANITQTNLITVSSFNGPNGLLLGFDLLRQPLEPHPLFTDSRMPPVYRLEPLLAATRALYGTRCEPRFPIFPGEHVLCAYKVCYRVGPCTLYGSLAVGIAADRCTQADLFMEDHGVLSDGLDDDETGRSETLLVHNLVRAVATIGDNLGVSYERVFAGFKSCVVPDGHMGCVLTAAPYIHLANQAMPGGMAEMTLPQWEQAVDARFVGI